MSNESTRHNSTMTWYNYALHNYDMANKQNSFSLQEFTSFCNIEVLHHKRSSVVTKLSFVTTILFQLLGHCNESVLFAMNFLLSIANGSEVVSNNEITFVMIKSIKNKGKGCRNNATMRGPFALTVKCSVLDVPSVPRRFTLAFKCSMFDALSTPGHNNRRMNEGCLPNSDE